MMKKLKINAYFIVNFFITGAFTSPGGPGEPPGPASNLGASVRDLSQVFRWMLRVLGRTLGYTCTRVVYWVRHKYSEHIYTCVLPLSVGRGIFLVYLNYLMVFNGWSLLDFFGIRTRDSSVERRRFANLATTDIHTINRNLYMPQGNKLGIQKKGMSTSCAHIGLFLLRR